jgi:8-oxo-dGTP diphosphatase
MTDYQNPSYAADVVLFAFDGTDLWTLLVSRGREPFGFALPGGFVNSDETSQAAAARELHEETGIPLPKTSLIPVGVFDEPDRDPRGWVVSSAFTALVDFNTVNQFVGTGKGDGEEGQEIKECRWFSVSGSPPELVFDHLQIISHAAAVVLWGIGGKPWFDFKGLNYEERCRIESILDFEKRQEEQRKTEASEEDLRIGSHPDYKEKPISPRAIGRFEDDGGPASE